MDVLLNIPVRQKNLHYNIYGKLQYYIRSRLNEKAESMLNEVLTEAQDSFKTLLHYAARFNNQEITGKLIELGADVNRVAEDGQTPLMLAVKNRGVETAKTLLEAGARIDIVDANGKNALQMVFAPGCQLVRPLLLEKLQSTASGIDELVAKLIVGGCNLYHAAYTNNFDVMERMLEHGVDVNSWGNHGKTALHVAVEMDNLGLAKWLIDTGADVNARNDDGFGALSFAVVPIKRAMLQFLLEHEADPNIEDDRNEETPLYAFATHVQDNEDVIKCMEILMHYDAVPRNATEFNWDILEYALYKKHFKRVYHLIAQIAMLKMNGAIIDKSVLNCDIEKIVL